MTPSGLEDCSLTELNTLLFHFFPLLEAINTHCHTHHQRPCTLTPALINESTHLALSHSYQPPPLSSLLLPWNHSYYQQWNWGRHSTHPLPIQIYNLNKTILLLG